MRPTDDDLDILQDMEMSIAGVWRAHPEMTDYSALRVYEAALQFYREIQRGHPPKAPALSGLDVAAYEALKAACERRLQGAPSSAHRLKEMHPVPLEKLVDCLRELAKSVARHTKVDGRQAYLMFIDRFLP
jgi:hypothetical protein